MTQRQLDLLQYRLDDFKNITFLENEVVCEINERFALIVRRHRHSSQVLLKGGKRRLNLPADIFDSICNAQISILFLRQFMENDYGK